MSACWISLSAPCHCIISYNVVTKQISIGSSTSKRQVFWITGSYCFNTRLCYINILGIFNTGIFKISNKGIFKILPSSNFTLLLKLAIYSWFIHKNLWFCMVMWLFTRGYCVKTLWISNKNPRFFEIPRIHVGLSNKLQLKARNTSYKYL